MSATTTTVGSMAHLEYPDYVAHIRAESVRFREVLADCDATAPVPSCPEWTAADLLFHLGKVQEWWATVLRDRPAEPEDVEPERPASYDALLSYYDEGLEALPHALASADPGEEAWSWSSDPAHHRVGWIARRQAHEALIHRLDAELTAGERTALDPVLAADGVEECLAVMYGGLPPWGSFDPLPQHVELRMPDVDASVWVRLGLFSGTSPKGEVITREKDLHLVDDPGAAADAVVTADAGTLDAWLWHRTDGDAVRLSGDEGALAHLREVLSQSIG